MTGSNMRRTEKGLKKDRFYLMEGYFQERVSVACPLKAEETWKIPWEGVIKSHNLPAIIVHPMTSYLKSTALHSQAAQISCNLEGTVGFLHVSI